MSRTRSTVEPMTGNATVNGTQLTYTRQGDGEPLVMVHGFTLDRRMWNDQLKAFAPLFNLVRYDLRGFGQSAAPDGAPYVHADDLAALLDHLGIERAHVMGLSLGGGIALDFACLHPDRLNDLVLVDAAMGGYPWTGSFNVKRGASDLAGYRRNWLAHGLFVPALRQPAVATRLRQMVEDYSGWHWLNKDSDQFPPPSVFERLETIHARTLAVVGEWDLPDFLGIAEAIARRAPHARKIVITGAGHMSNMEQPEVFNQIVLDFLREGNEQQAR
jgi:pimeloyl-ACP methyl ester carboxylesterase